MLNILVFWLGDKKQLQTIKKKFNSLHDMYGVKITYGPTEQEHSLLYEKNKFYKCSYDKKIFPFCSDVWRMYKLCNLDNVLYIDANMIINCDRFGEYIELTKKYNLIVQYESKYIIVNGFIFSKKRNNPIFRNCLKTYERTANIKNIKSGPYLLSKNIYKYFGYKLSTTTNEDQKLLCLHPKEISNFNNNSIFKYGGQATWNNIGVDATLKYFKLMEDKFDEAESIQILAIKRFFIILFFHKWLGFFFLNKFAKKIYYSLSNNK